MKVMYFAWLKQRIGHGEEELDRPPGVASVGGLMDWLAGQGPGYAAAFESPDIIRAAINQTHVPMDAPFNDGDEIAFFPPVTGG